MRDLDKTTSLKALPQGFQDSVMCLLNVGQNSQGTCKGDSGGPLFRLTKVNETFRFIQYGSVHGSLENCGSSNFPGIFVRLSEKHVHEFLLTLGKKNGRKIYQASNNGKPATMLKYCTHIFNFFDKSNKLRM